MKKIINIMTIATMFVSCMVVPLTANAVSAEKTGQQEKTIINVDEEKLIPYIYDENQKFTHDCVLVCLKRAYGGLNKKWKIKDFPVSNLASVKDLTYIEMSPEKQAEYLENVDFHQILKFTLKEQSVEAVLKAIDEFEKCEEVLSVGPNCIPNSNDVDINTSDEEKLIPYIYDEKQEFTYDCILVCLKKNYGELNKEWEISDFPVSNLESVTDLTYMEMTPERQAEYLDEVDFHQILKFTLTEQSFDAVMKAIDEFEKCEGVLSVEPNCISKNNEVLKGDSNCDGTVDMSDVVLVMQALANPDKYGINGSSDKHLTPQGRINADIDGSGMTVGDANAIQNKLLNK